MASFGDLDANYTTSQNRRTNTDTISTDKIEYTKTPLIQKETDRRDEFVNIGPSQIENGGTLQKENIKVVEDSKHEENNRAALEESSTDQNADALPKESEKNFTRETEQAGSDSSYNADTTEFAEQDGQSTMHNMRDISHKYPEKHGRDVIELQTNHAGQCRGSTSSDKVNRTDGDGVEHKESEALNDDDILYTPVDGGYGWVIVAASFILQVISCGLAFSVGVLMVEWIDRLNEEVAITSMVGSINCGLLFGAGPFASILTNRLDHRTVIIIGSLASAVGLVASAFCSSVIALYLTYGILCGIGFCLMYIPAVVIVGIYFDKHRPFAMALTASGAGAGALAFAPFLRFLVSYYGLTGALLIEAGIALQGAIMGSLMRPIQYTNLTNFKNRHKTSHKDHRDIFNFSLLRHLKFWVFFVNNILWNIGCLTLLVLLSDYAEESGFTKLQGAYVVAIVGLASTLGRLLAAGIGSVKHINSFYMYVSSNILAGVLIALYPIKETFILFAVLSALYGTMFGVQVGVMGPVTVDLFGVRRLSSAYGYLMLANGIGALSGPPLAGCLYVVHNAYELPFILGGVITIFSGAVMLSIPILKRRENMVYAVNIMNTTHKINDLSID